MAELPNGGVRYVADGVTPQMIPIERVDGLLAEQRVQDMRLMGLERRQLVLLRILVAQLSALIIMAGGLGALAWFELAHR